MRLVIRSAFIAFFCTTAFAFTSNGICMEQNPAKDGNILITFDQERKIPDGFRAETTGYARYDAVWEVVSDKHSPSPPNILKITEIKAASGGQFNIFWTPKIKFYNGSISIMVRADTGRIDQGGGPIWRVRDKKNYYVARLNPLEDNFRIYFVKNGRRIMIGSADVHGIKAGEWFTVKITTHDEKITGYVNGKKLIEVMDSTFSHAGGVGIWSKADAASSFDNLIINIAD